MNNPLDTNAFRHYLRFISLGRTQLYEICEPISFDAANFIQDQESKGWSRDSEAGALDKMSFVDIWGVGTITPRAYNMQGDSANHLDSGLQYLLYIYKKWGFQAKVEYVLEKNGLQFSGGMLDFTDKNVTDGYNFVACKLIQKNAVADLKRRLDDKFNLYGTVDAKNNTITPAPTIDFLRKAQPLINKSKWTLPAPKTFSLFYSAPLPRFIFNYLNKVDEYNVNDTLSFIQDSYNINSDAQAEGGASNFIYLRARNNISNGTLKFTNINLDFSAIGLADYRIQAYYVITKNGVFDYDDKVEILDLVEPTSATINLTVNNVSIQRDNAVHFWIEGSFLGTGGGGVKSLVTTWNTGEITFQGTEKAFDTVVKGIRWVEAIKQGAKFGCGLPVYAPLYDVGGPHYNHVVFNRRGISGKTDTFTATPKLLLESVEEKNCDYEPNENEIFIGHQTDFYKNVEIGVFNVLPEEDSFGIEENDRHQVNKAVIGYKTFTQERTELGTNNAIHTEAEFRLLNDNVENVFERKFDFVRDPYTHQSIVDLEISQPSTSTNDDDKINIVEITALAPTSFNIEVANLYMRINAGKVEMLNRSEEFSERDVVINWETLGFGVGSSFQILLGENAGNYTVFSITPSVLTLTPIAFTPTYVGDSFITMKWFYTNVLYVTRTDEGFISNPLKIQNASSSIKRTITNYFGEHLAAMLYYEKANIINGYFKSNGKYSSQIIGEASPVIEDSNILYSSLPNPLVTPRIINATCFAEFEDVLSYIDAYKLNRGFVRCFDSYGRIVKGFVQKLDHLWLENRLKLTLEEKFQPEFLEITSSGSGVFVEDYPNSLSGFENWWRFDNDFIILYDNENRPLNNADDYSFDKVRLNGVVYETKEELVTALLSL